MIAAAPRKKGEWIGLHTRIADRKQFCDPGPALPDQNFDGVGAVRRRFPFGLRAERHLPAPLGTFPVPVIECLGHVSVIRGSIHNCPRTKPPSR